MELKEEEKVMKNQDVFRKKMRIFLIIPILLCGAVMAGYGQICGDVDGSGSVTIVDALKVAQAYVGLNPTNYNSAVADVDANGTVNIVDALRIAQYYVGSVAGLNCGGTVTPESTATTPAGTPQPGAHLDNPFLNANIYVNPDWSSKASSGGGSAIANQPTFVWIDRIAKISGGTGTCSITSLTHHLDNAVAQGSNAIQLVISDMPYKDCTKALITEYDSAEDSVRMYKTEFIDPIVSILKNYGNLRIICIIEPDTIPNLITNLSYPRCVEANSIGAFDTCIQYAVDQLKSVGSNVYLYLDIAHDAWLGWEDNFQPFVAKLSQIIGGCKSGKSAIDGFVSNVGKTLPWEEPFLGPDANAIVNGKAIKESRFIDWNQFTCERPFVEKMRAAFISAGFSSDIGMISDTSRNGWGGPNRPRAKSASTDINTYVDESRIDRRYHRSNWCNVGLAGIGARPQAAPAPGMDAFVWVNAPGESDGQSATGSDPCDPYKTLDQMCVPGGINTYCNCGQNDAMSGAPSAGVWFQALFTSLCKNAYPAF
jgi:cellulase/cellobiase CelA1